MRDGFMSKNNRLALLTLTHTRANLAQEVFAVGAGCAVTLQAIAVPPTGTHALCCIFLLTETRL